MKKHLTINVIMAVLLAFCLSIDCTQAQTWEPTNGPYGATIQCFAENSSYLFTGTGGGVNASGVFRSADHGAHWTAANSGLTSANQGMDIAAMCVIGNYIVESSGGNIYRSNNNGTSWTSTNYNAIFNPVCFVTDALGSNIYCGGSSGVFVSADAGLNWTSLNAGFPGGSSVQVRAMGFCGTYLYVACASGKKILRSPDNGLTWETVYGGLPTGFTSYNSLVVSESNVYVSAPSKGVFHLANNGTTWVNESTGLTNLTNLNLFVRSDSIYCSTGNGLWRSTLGATLNWNLVTTAQIGFPFNSGSDVFAKYQGAVAISNGALTTWTPSSIGINGISTSKVLAGNGSDILAVTGLGTIKTSNQGTNWDMTTIPGVSGQGYPIFAYNSTLFSLGTRSYDNGATWSVMPYFPVSDSINTYDYFLIGDTIFAGGANALGLNAVFFSIDNGDSWRSTSGITGTGSGSHVSSIAGHGSYLFAGTISGNGSPTVNGIYQSADKGLSWTLSAAMTTSIPVTCLADNGTYIFAGTDNVFNDGNTVLQGIYRSGDNGVSWETANNGLGNLSIRALAVSGTDLYAGTASGIFKSSDKGDTWTAFNEGYASIPQANSLFVEGNYMYSGANHSPIYRRALSGTAPDMPSPIVGSVTPCRNTSQVYSVTNVPGVTYSWQFPAGWVITAGGTTNSVTVTVGTNTGLVLVTPANGWGTGPAQYLIISQTIPTPSQPSVITGSATPNEGTTQAYSVTNVPGVTYTWTFPAGWVQTGGGTTNAITVTVGSGSGSISVTPSTVCGNGTDRKKAVAPISLPPATKNLNFKVFLEGLYNAESGLLVKTQGSATGETTYDMFAGNVADTLSIALAETTAPFNTVYSIHGVPLHTDGSIALSSVPGTLSGTYYIIVRHRNHVETWSQAVSLGGAVTNYDFTTDVAKAWGSNLKQMGSAYCLFAGDSNGDQYVDVVDVGLVFNKNLDGSFGYQIEDLNGDGFIDVLDVGIVFNNNLLGAGQNTPINPMSLIRPHKN